MEPLSTQPSVRLFEQFLAERRYLKNVTPKTLIWYDTAFQSYQKAQPGNPCQIRPVLQAWVIANRGQWWRIGAFHQRIS